MGGLLSSSFVSSCIASISLVLILLLVVFNALLSSCLLVPYKCSHVFVLHPNALHTVCLTLSSTHLSPKRRS